MDEVVSEDWDLEEEEEESSPQSIRNRSRASETPLGTPKKSSLCTNLAPQASLLLELEPSVALALLEEERALAPPGSDSTLAMQFPIILRQLGPPPELACMGLLRLRLRIMAEEEELTEMFSSLVEVPSSWTGVTEGTELKPLVAAAAGLDRSPLRSSRDSGFVTEFIDVGGGAAAAPSAPF